MDQPERGEIPNAKPERHGDDGTAFKREGPTPASADTGETVEDMNRAAEDALLNNVRPDQAVD